ncbi:hypothetical protein ACPUVO_04155 [Pseudocolwellia sp. HL-MZ19]|uniref:hypothetical protein n=1 Tax=unclassified Pseudocolwellia TaxID=2848178 RepID=UPI003CF2E71D
MLPSLVEKLIESCTREDHIDVKAFCEALGVTIALRPEIKNLCEIHLEGETKSPVISLSPTLDKKTKFTFVVIALAEYILTPDRVARMGICYDIFFLQDIYHQRHGYRMLLATRIALPEKLVNIAGSTSPDAEHIINNSNYLPQFLRCCVNNSSALFLLANFSDLPSN